MTMRILVHGAGLAVYAVIAVFVWAWAPVLVDGAGPGIDLLAGAGVFLAAAWIHEAVLRRIDRKSTAKSLSALGEAQTSLGAKLSGLQSKIDHVQATVGIGEGSGGNPDMVGEMRVIRSLLKKLTDKQSPPSSDTITEDFAPDALAGEFSPSEILEIIRLGLEQNRVDLYLQPVVSLPQRKVRYYEVFSRIRHENGGVVKMVVRVDP